MRKILIGCILALACVGCCGTLAREAAYHDGVKQLTIESGMIAEYEKYLDADPKLNPQAGDDDATKDRKKNTKRIRKNTPKELRALIAEEDKALKDD